MQEGEVIELAIMVGTKTKTITVHKSDRVEMIKERVLKSSDGSAMYKGDPDTSLLIASYAKPPESPALSLGAEAQSNARTSTITRPLEGGQREQTSYQVALLENRSLGESLLMAQTRLPARADGVVFKHVYLDKYHVPRAWQLAIRVPSRPHPLTHTPPPFSLRPALADRARP